MRKRWVAMFSQTGTEIADICKYWTAQRGTFIDIPKPDYIITNNVNTDSWHDVVYNYYKESPAKFIVSRDINFINECLREFNPMTTLITLNGYLRILPDDITKKYDIYNVHPGDIEKYPELIGIHPQQKALDLQLNSTGVIIHKVTDELDQGTIISRETYDIKKNTDIETLVDDLRGISVKMWTNFLLEQNVEA